MQNPLALLLVLSLSLQAIDGCLHDRQRLRGGGGPEQQDQASGHSRENLESPWNQMHTHHHHHQHQQQQRSDGTNYEDMARKRRDLSDSSFLSICGTASPPEELKVEMGVAYLDWKKSNELNRRNLANLQYTVNVVFHVITDDNGLGSVSETDIQNGYMASLQKAFINSPFQFRLQLITTISNSDWYACGAGNEDAFKEALYVPGKNTLNVYLCDPWSSFGPFGAYGWSSLPVHAGTNRDGIVMMNPTVVDPLSAYQTFVHESGHYMGLFHTFGKFYMSL